ncbi:MAG: HpcH/HpaI aldolase/citrate lyase family protein, partial [Lachnospiraceae bacterium]
SIVPSLVNETFGTQFSLALCLEDTIRDELVMEAEKDLNHSLHQLSEESQTKNFYLPKIFIRVREPRQIGRIYHLLQDVASLITGFIVPKFSLANADDYISEILRVNETSSHAIYMMPILESPTMINLQTRYDILYGLKNKLDHISQLVLNIRVGGNDLCHNFGFRRHSNESIYEVLPVAGILADIFTVFGMEYVVSGPVWEYYSGKNWKEGLEKELRLDQLNGFVGKTVIHPNQIAIVNQGLSVAEADYEDAASILNWNADLAGLVSGSSHKERMNEFKTHHNWAKKIMMLSQLYGIKK